MFVACLIAVMFGVTLGGFFATHLSMVMRNQTTLEFYYDVRHNCTRPDSYCAFA